MSCVQFAGSLVIVKLALLVIVAQHLLWEDVTDRVLPETAEWTNYVELADVDGDGRVDLLFANGGNYSEPGEPEPNRVFLNRGDRFERNPHSRRAGYCAGHSGARRER